MDGVLITIILVVGLGMLLYIGLKIIKYLKGSVKISLLKNSFLPGETILGKVFLKSKKEITSNRFYICLEGYKESKSRNSKGGYSKSWHKIYSGEVNLDNSKVYQKGTMTPYDFRIKVPTNKEIGKFSSGNKIIDTTINLASSVLGLGRMKWYIKGTLDAQGIDLSSKKRVYVNTSNVPTMI